jgi:transcriptional regulator with XRE-family HTH domain
MEPHEIKALRRKLGLTQAKFGEKIGVSRSQVSYYESGLTLVKRNSKADDALNELSLNQSGLRTLDEPAVYKKKKSLSSLKKKAGVDNEGDGGNSDNSSGLDPKISKRGKRATTRPSAPPPIDK